MITDVEYMQLISEYYDLSDYRTKRELIFCNEAKKSTNVEHIVNNLYNHIKNNVAGIDFGTIPKSKGIVTKVDNYANIVDCLNTIHDLVVEYREDPVIVDTLLTTLNNIQIREKTFTKAFALNIEIPIMFYNTAVLAVISGTSLLISSSIEYIKNGHDSFTASFDKAGYVKSENHVLYQYASQFNKECANGNLDRLFSQCIKNNLTGIKESVNINDLENLDEFDFSDIKSSTNSVISIISIIGTSLFALKLLFTFLRRGIYLWLRMRMSVSDWFAIQAEFLQINAENLKYRDDDKGEDHQKKVYQRQIKWVERFKAISNALALKNSKAQKEAQKDDDEYSKKRRKDEDDNNDDDEDDGSLF